MRIGREGNGFLRGGPGERGSPARPSSSPPNPLYGIIEGGSEGEPAPPWLLALICKAAPHPQVLQDVAEQPVQDAPLGLDAAVNL